MASVSLFMAGISHIPLAGGTTVGLFFHPLIDIWVVSAFVYWTMLLWSDSSVLLPNQCRTQAGERCLIIKLARRHHDGQKLEWAWLVGKWTNVYQQFKCTSLWPTITMLGIGSTDPSVSGHKDRSKGALNRSAVCVAKGWRQPALVQPRFLVLTLCGKSTQWNTVGQWKQHTLCADRKARSIQCIKWGKNQSAKIYHMGTMCISNRETDMHTDKHRHHTHAGREETASQPQEGYTVNSKSVISLWRAELEN